MIIIHRFMFMKWWFSLWQLVILWMIVLICISCGGSEQITSDPDQAFAQKEYALASQLLIERYDRNPQSKDAGMTAFQIGYALEKANQQAEAVDWYDIAHKQGYGPRALQFKAYALKYTEDYVRAIEAFDELEQLSVNKTPYREQKIICRKAMQWIAEPRPYDLINISFNTPQNEYAPVVDGDGNLYISADTYVAFQGEDKTYWWTGNGYSRIFAIDSDQVDLIPIWQWERSNYKYNEGNLVLNPNGLGGVYVRCDAGSEAVGYCQLYSWTITEDKSWKSGEVLSFVREGVNYSYPAFNEDGTVLLFSSDMSGGQGGYDLYFVDVFADGSYGEPEPMPKSLNTPGDETSPHVYKDTLYYSSDGLPGMGGKDIFSTYIKENGFWSTPRNLEYPINSGGDDFSYYRVSEREGYLASNRSSSKGGDDVFHWMRNDIIPDKDTLIADLDSSEFDVDEDFVYALEVEVKTKEYLDRRKSSSFSGSLKALKNAEVRLKTSGDSLLLITNPSGIVRQNEAKLDQVYVIEVRKSGYFTTTRLFDPQSLEIENGDVIRLILELDRIFLGEEVVLQNIYYDLDKWDIRPDAEPALDSLIILLELNPEIDITLGSHTDCRGSDDYNIELSQKRAQSVVNYLVSNGIGEERLAPKGYGESRLRVTCTCEDCTEEEHQLNRRTTFEVMQ